jgi:hypothetical protein
MRTDKPTSVDDMEIAPGVKVKEWKALDLRNNKQCEDDWQRAVAIVEKRLMLRYFEPCKLLRSREIIICSNWYCLF